MDEATLQPLLDENGQRQFWLKPVGPPKDHPDWGAEELRTWAHPEIEVHFTKNPVQIAVGAVVIAYRIRIQTLIYVAQRLSAADWTTEEEKRSEYWRQRYPYYFKARNLTPEFGASWKRFSIQPFPLADEYNESHGAEPARLGAINRGQDKVSIPRWFADVLMRRILEAR